ncbi:hypothetical protein B0A52_09901 [Exophiala mesophila]|uniref:trimethyllysine dioxygenase n=1 Tax=Exophiala mesophila TaxID=212818 RepID=A0A438MQR7_EXOME|nr:hypothetical protein B0A52_09901 [Exophiala mesophila]
MVNDMANQEILVDFPLDGKVVRYPSFWLRDQCPCSSCQHPTTHQRQLDTFSIDPEIKVQTVKSTPEGLEVTWPTSPADEMLASQNPDDSHRGHDHHHHSLYDWTWLSSHPPFLQTSTSPSGTPSSPLKHLEPTREWIHVPTSTPAASLPRVSYPSIMSTDNGLREFLSHIHRYGLCFMPETPVSPSATQDLIERIAHIRATHYGGFWDFTSEVNPIDTAYTNDYLPPHTDTTYFTDPAGLQLFHCLSHTAIDDPMKPGAGGESTFVDGFAAAQRLFHTRPELYNVLSSTPIVSAALGSPAGEFYNTASNAKGYPVLVHTSAVPGRSNPSPKTLTQIRWNNLDRLAPTVPSFLNHTALKQWYTAAREWSNILSSPEFLLTIKLQPGEPVIFDNWRTLHGRLAFEGKRRICGAYIGMDDFQAKLRGVGIEV